MRLPFQRSLVMFCLHINLYLRNLDRRFSHCDMEKKNV